MPRAGGETAVRQSAVSCGIHVTTDTGVLQIGGDSWTTARWVARRAWLRSIARHDAFLGQRNCHNECEDKKLVNDVHVRMANTCDGRHWGLPVRRSRALDGGPHVSGPTPVQVHGAVRRRRGG